VDVVFGDKKQASLAPKKREEGAHG
jgi:hypothetical protein